MMQSYVGEAIEGLMNQLHLGIMIALADALQRGLHIFRVEHRAKQDQEVACEAADLILLHCALLRFVPLARVFQTHSPILLDIDLNEGLKTLSVKLRSLAALLGDIICCRVELMQVVASELAKDCFKHDIRPLLGLQLHIQIFEGVVLTYP